MAPQYQFFLRGKNNIRREMVMTDFLRKDPAAHKNQQFLIS
jgi:hypothetical protein